MSRLLQKRDYRSADGADFLSADKGRLLRRRQNGFEVQEDIREQLEEYIITTNKFLEVIAKVSVVRLLFDSPF